MNGRRQQEWSDRDTPLRPRACRSLVLGLIALTLLLPRLAHAQCNTTLGQLDCVQYSTNLSAGEWAYATAVGASVRLETVHATIDGVNTNAKWCDFVFVPTVNKLFAAPFNAKRVLIVDPFANTTDTTALVGLGQTPSKWFGITFAPNVNKVFATPWNSNAVLIIDPVANTTDVTTLVGVGNTTVDQWSGITFVPTVNRLYAAPHNANSVLIVDFEVDSHALLPFRLVTELMHQHDLMDASRAVVVASGVGLNSDCPVVDRDCVGLHLQRAAVHAVVCTRSRVVFADSAALGADVAVDDAGGACLHQRGSFIRAIVGTGRAFVCASGCGVDAV
jgi:hypothetical protein